MSKSSFKTEAAPAQLKAPARLFYLDWIRVICTLLIVIYHFPLSLSGGTDWLHSTRNGRWGVAVVYVFFMISGAALFHCYKNREDFSALRYLKKRWLRLFPLYYLAYLGGFLASFWVLGRTYDAIPSSAIIWTIFGIDGYLADIVPTFVMVGEWFLGAILFIYLLFPLLRSLCRRWGTGRMLVLFLVPALFFFYHNPIALIEVKKNLFVDIFFFLLGAWIGEKSDQGRFSSTLFRSVLFCISLFWLLLWIFVPFPELSFSAGAAVSLLEFRVNLTDAAGALMLYLFLLSQASFFARFSGLRQAVFYLSRYTYGVFLVHHMTESLICLHFQTQNFGNRNTLVLLVLCLAAIWAATAALYGTQAYLRRAFLQVHT